MATEELYTGHSMIFTVSERSREKQNREWIYGKENKII